MDRVYITNCNFILSIIKFSNKEYITVYMDIYFIVGMILIFASSILSGYQMFIICDSNIILYLITLLLFVFGMYIAGTKKQN